MKPKPEDEQRLLGTLTRQHGQKFRVLQEMGRQFAHNLQSLPDWRLVDSPQPSRHVGRVIVDLVLSVGHDFEKQVRTAVEMIKEHPEAATVSGFITLLEPNPLGSVLNFGEDSTKEDLLSVARFFQRQGIETYDDLYRWLDSEEHRDGLLTENSNLGGKVFRIADKTADYARKLVGHWDAVAIDRGFKGLFAETGIMPRYATRWTYKEKRTVAQLAALSMGCTPRDLDNAVYRLYVSRRTLKGPSDKEMNRRTVLPTPVPSARQPGEEPGRPKFCMECGQIMPETAKYCPKCGERQP